MEDCNLRALFMMGFKNIDVTAIPKERQSDLALIHLGQIFARQAKFPPKHIYRDEDSVVNVSNDMLKSYALFYLGKSLKLVDNYGEIFNADALEVFGSKPASVRQKMAVS